MKNWSDYDIEFPVDFPVATKNRSIFWSRIGSALEVPLLAFGYLVFYSAVAVLIGCAILMLAALVYGFIMTWIDYPLWTSLGVGAALVAYAFCYRAVKKGVRL